MMIYGSICSNPAFTSHSTIFPFGLGTSNQVCKIISGVTTSGEFNGDGITKCGVEENYKAPEGYLVRGQITIKVLDDLMQNYKRIGVLKVMEN